jgi:large subunit ribosomal protein L25
MSKIISLAAQRRDRAGKGAARATRREGRVPAVIYGNKQEPVTISVDPRALDRELHKPGFFTHLFDIELEGATHRVLARDVQLDVVTDRPLHVDFLRVSETSKLHIDVPVIFQNQDKCPGIRAGGVLNVVRHTVELVCSALAIPENLVVDLAGAQIGDSIHISAVKVPEGAHPAIADRDFTIATIVPPLTAGKDAA